MAEFSDPQWWPKPPPKPPTPITLGTVVVRTFLPVVVIAAAAALILTQGGGHPAHPAVQSLAAYEACLKAHPHAAGSAAERGCQAFLPPGTAIGRYGKPDPGQAAFQRCVQNATASLPNHGFGGGGRPGGGGFGGGPSAAFRRAVEVCQSLTQGGGSAPATTTTGSGVEKA